MTQPDERAGRRCHNVINPLHSTVYFSPDTAAALADLGVTDDRAVYFATRAAAFGAVGPGTVAATFYTFSYDLIARHLPAVWETVTPRQVLDARLRAADATLRRLLGEEAVASKEMAEAAELALRATEACERGARPLYAAHADLPVPEQPHLALWHAATLLREHRGDGHLMVLTAAGLTGLDAQASHTASGRGMSPEWVMRTRGYTGEQWEAARQRLRDRGLLDADGGLSDAGLELRRGIEAETDRLDQAPYAHLGPEGVARLTELGTAFTTAALEAGAFPADLFGKS
ncbi:hypothetical protein V1J52_02145 [Streptomyces sp. TRM 70351]|uniref:SCO6745 family protein n=1 Tax=Streptomyces sp. TRM 70351 TaxID=3116552 RepID=UPI002E7C3770|nr:hypothetical protein [Streptomyces sp. TRM 70351]MEE1926991.1 hypothetical protein [Streptomyces sp. TRM 70351]